MDKKSNSNRILFIESGTTIGGSIESLYLHLEHYNKCEFHPIVVLLNETEYFYRFIKLGINVFLLKDTIYSINRFVIISKVLSRVEYLVGLYFKRLYVLVHSIFHYSLIKQLEKIVLQQNINLIYLNIQVNRDLFGVILSKKTGVKCISHLRSIRSAGFNKWTAKFVNNYVSYFIANSGEVKDFWVSHGLSKDKISVIYNGIPNLNNSAINLHKMYSLEKDCLIIGSVGRLISWKRHDFLIETFSVLLAKYDNLVLFIVGGGPLMLDLKLTVDKLNIQNKVIFTGEILNAKEYIKSFDIMVLPSINEPFGRVIIEAMALGTPVIASKSGGIPEIIEDGKNGYLFNPDDKSDLLLKMDSLLKDFAKRASFSFSGMQSVRTKFSLDSYINKLEGIFKSLNDTETNEIT